MDDFGARMMTMEVFGAVEEEIQTYACHIRRFPPFVHESETVPDPLDGKGRMIPHSSFLQEIVIRMKIYSSHDIVDTIPRDFLGERLPHQTTLCS